jgi:hypothetical protein
VSAQTLIVLDSGNTLVVRAGLSPSVLNPRPSGTHWNLRIPLLAGFSYYKGSDSAVENPGTASVSVCNVYHFDTGLDATYWGKSGVGFNMRILVNLGTARKRQIEQDAYFNNSSSDSGLVGGSFMIGISFAGL